MKESKIELKDIAGYLPYKVLIIFERKCYPVSKETKKMSISDIDLWNKFPKKFGVKPILRPMSDLYNPCLEGGKTPIKELCKLVYDSKNSSIFDNSDEYEIREQYCYPANGKKRSTYWITYNDRMQSFDHQEIEGCLPQLELFQKLYEWHFDVHGLIEKGLAIDINTAEI